ncbi:MAG: hypothetical protein HY237_10295 [Acidobacteria bacterium]|nr:hypothetical protein [Acidobacteriota bacterium]
MRIRNVLLVFLGAVCVVLVVFGTVRFQGRIEAAVLPPPSEVPAGFDDETNGLVPQGDHLFHKGQFDEVEGPEDGLGPLYNAQSCRECHQSVVSGAVSQVTELRAGHTGPHGHFVAANITIGDGAFTVLNRSLVNDRAICPNADFPDLSIQEHVPPAEHIRALRTSLNILGDGFVEAVADADLLAIAAKQRHETHGEVHGQAILVDVLEAPGTKRVGRFGWKDQHASLLSFSADAYLNEMGFTSRLLPDEVTTLCNPKGVQEPNDRLGTDGLFDIDHFTLFMRATKAPPRDEPLAATLDARIGSDLFDQVGCATCHVCSLTTVPPGTKINGGTFTVPDALGNKVFHPFSDFLLHHLGTGDGIVQNGGQETAQKLRTPPLWGVRTHSRLMHDGKSLNFHDAIERHRGEGKMATEKFNALSEEEKRRLITFLKSL